MKRLILQFWRQLHLVYRLTFHPDLDSAVYLNRTRLNIAALTMVALDVVYAFLWLFVFRENQHSSGAFLLFAASCSALAFVNLHYRFVPWFSQLAVVIFCLWLNMPVLALYIYLSVQPHVNALANTIVLLLLYMHIQDWRSSVLGILLASATAPVVYFFSTQNWPNWPPVLQIFMLATVLGGAIIVAVSSANLTQMRRRYAQKVLQVTQDQLRPALQQQSELIGNMRYEARNILQDEHQRLALDHLAHTLQTQLDQLNADILRLASVSTSASGLASWQAVGMLRTSDILAMARNDLMASYHFSAQALDQALQQELQDDVVIEANGAEISQALAALIAPMLQAAAQRGTSEQEATPLVRLRNWRQGHVGKLRIQSTLKPEQQPAAPKPVRPLLPPFTAYIFRLFHISWQVHAVFADGSPADIELSCPLPSHAASPTYES